MSLHSFLKLSSILDQMESNVPHPNGWCRNRNYYASIEKYVWLTL